MLFQTFDDKEKCIAIYAAGRLYRKKMPKKPLTTTWTYSEFLKDKEDIEYLKLYCHGKSLDDVCPEYLRSRWKEVNNRLKAFYRSAKEVDLDLNKHCFFELVPEYFLLEYARIKDDICNYVKRTHEKPENYDFLCSLTKILIEMKNKKLNVDYSGLNARLHEFKVRNFVKKNKNTSPYVIYDAFGTKTGRLATKNSFPILTMDKTYRKIIKPNNDWFIELDYNAAELRVLLGLLDKEQPQEDIHEWNIKNVYGGSITREEAKKRIFAWLYNPKSKDKLSNKAYDRDSILKKHYNGKQVSTFFSKVIEADKHHALNYIVQSTSADLFLRQMIKVWELLKNKKSYIAFSMHDSLIIDYCEEDKGVLAKIKNTFAETELGNFLVNVSVGKNFGAMKRLTI